MRFLWLDINASYSHSSLAIPALHAQLSKDLCKKSTWKVISGTIKTPPDELISEAFSYKPHFVFSTVWLFNRKPLEKICGRLKALLPQLRIVLGGPEFLGDNEFFLKNNGFAEAVFRGEGEEIFPRFIASLLAEGPRSNTWKELPGFEFLDPAGEYRASFPVTVTDFAALVPPEQSRFFRWDKAFVQLETSRGCFNTCKFCVSGIDRSPVQEIPLPEIDRRLGRIVRKGIREVRILDRTFNARGQRAAEMLRLFARYAGKIRFHVEIHPALLGDALKKELAALPGGLLHIEAGLQSLHQPVIGACSRKGNTEQALRGVEYLLSLGKFPVHTDLIAGLPQYTYARLLEDTRQLIGCGPDEIQLESLKLLPGTFFRINSRESGIRYSPEPPYEVLQTGSISYDDLRRSMVLSKILESWYNDSRWHRFFRETVSYCPDFLPRAAEHLFRTGFAASLYSFESLSLLLYDLCKRFAPERLHSFSVAWIRNGLSIKKEPANRLVPWKIRKNPQAEPPENPLFQPGNTRMKYYFLKENGTMHWFAFNKEEDRNRPVNYASARISETIRNEPQ